MADYLQVVTPYLPPELAAPDALQAIYSTARSLPPLDLGGFECRLGGDSRVDFQVKLPQSTVLSRPSPATHRRWPALRLLHERLEGCGARLADRIDAVGLEFDLNAGQPSPARAAAFLALSRHTRFEPIDVVDLAEGFLKRPIHSRCVSSLEACVGALPVGATITHLGFLLSRSPTRIRINVAGIPPHLVASYLESVCWKAPQEFVRSLALRLATNIDVMVLGLDIETDVLPRVGFECSLLRQPFREPRWHQLLDVLMELGLCTSRKRDALLAWWGFVRERSAGPRWPGNLSWLDSMMRSEAISVFRRYLSHVKISYAPGAAAEAKAYLGFSHLWLDRDWLGASAAETG
jgi:hypothetical protein